MVFDHTPMFGESAPATQASPCPTGSPRPDRPDGGDVVTSRTDQTVAPQILAARAYLLRVAEPPCPPLLRFVAEHGPVDTVRRIRSAQIPDALRRVLLHTAAAVDEQRAADELDTAQRTGARLLVPEDTEWPAAAFTSTATSDEAGGQRDLGPPLGLWVRGPARLEVLCDRAVAVVGSRAATGYGAQVAAQLSATLGAADVSIISGGAFGIDVAAHRGALGAGAPTIAVLACGIDRAYPIAHTALLERIAATGLVVSEYPPGAVPARHRFLRRNSIIAHLARLATVIVEAGARSGSMSTAARAHALGRPVMAVPGPITSAASAGCHALIGRGAEIVCGGDQLLARIDELHRHEHGAAISAAAHRR